MDEMPPHTRLTIIITSRHFRGATEAVRSLQSYALKHHKSRPALIEFDYLLFDQCSMVSVLAAAYEIKRRYRQIDYVFFNSSYSQMGGIDYWQATKDFLSSPLRAFTVGTFKIQGPPRLSGDGMGVVFQANVFAPWYLVQEILPVLKPGAKLIWISSCISLPEFYDPSDLGIERNMHSYEASKYELEMLHAATYEPLLSEKGIESWILQPGVFKSTTFVPTLNAFMYFGMLMMFYICRWFGSPFHCIWPDIAANAPVWVALHADPTQDSMAIKYGSGTDRVGREVLMRSEIHPPKEAPEAVHKYVSALTKDWQDKLTDQVMEREGY